MATHAAVRLRAARALLADLETGREVVPGVDAGDLRALEPRIVAKAGAALIDTPTSVRYH